jgi:hypothetical protein
LIESTELFLLGVLRLSDHCAHLLRVLDTRQRPLPFSRSFRGFFPAIMKDAVAINRVNSSHQDSISFGLDQHKTAFEPLRAAPTVNGTATNGHDPSMANPDEVAVRTALAKLSVEEQVSHFAGLAPSLPWGWARCAQGWPLARLISRPACSVRTGLMHSQCSIPPCPAPRRVLLREGSDENHSE